jgi:single-strand DNA-binding protein
MNNWNFTGNLGNPAEVKVLSTGTTVCEFSVAVKSGYGDKEKTNWVRCAMFGKKAEGQLPSYLTKGTQVAVSGELELQEWEGQNGKGAALSVIVGTIDLIGGKPQGQSNQAPQQQGYAPQQQQPQGGYQQPSQQQQQYQQAPQQQQPQGGFNPNHNPNDPPF